MKKHTLLSLITGMTCASLVHAGCMGDTNSCFTAFAALEGGYAVNKIAAENYTINGIDDAISVTKTQKKYAGRLAAGMINMLDEQIGVSGELGWGYYGSTTLTPANNSGVYGPFTIDASNKYTINGFDALIGVAFIQEHFSLAAKAGALVQNLKSERTVNATSGGNSGSVVFKNSITSTLPELKMTAAYNIDANWGITGSLVYAIGSSSKTNYSFDSTTGAYTATINNDNPTIGALLFGVQYTV